MKIIKRFLQEEYPFIFAAPALVWQLIFLYFPLIAIIFFSFFDFSAITGFLQWTLSHYINVFKPVYIKVITNSFVLACITSIICLLIAYPVAYFLSFKVKRFKAFWIFALVLPSWTNLIVQIYAWFFLLEKRGLISQLLYRIGVLSKPDHLMNNYFATLLGMVYCFLPFMILPIYTILEKMDRRLIEASADLGANQFRSFKKIILPISLPGIYTGLLLVFIPSFGEFVIPMVLGGAKRAYWGTVIVDKFLVAGDWRSGFALASVGIFFLVSVFSIFYFLLKITETIRQRRLQEIYEKNKNSFLGER